MLCDYGCGQEAKYQLKNGKWCCSKSQNSCPKIKNKLSESTKNSWRDNKYRNRKKKWLKKYRLNYLKSIKKKHPYFFKIETPSIDLKKLTIEVKCKQCKKYFEPSYNQLYERIRAIEKSDSFEENNFYCSDSCKQSCSIYRKRNGGSDNTLYGTEEYYTFRNYVLKKDNYKCQYCGEKAEHVHHERPQKLEPFFALDPILAWSVCKKCHYKYGHRDECSTNNIARRIC